MNTFHENQDITSANPFYRTEAMQIGSVWQSSGGVDPKYL